MSRLPFTSLGIMRMAGTAMSNKKANRVSRRTTRNQMLTLLVVPSGDAA